MAVYLVALQSLFLEKRLSSSFKNQMKSHVPLMASRWKASTLMLEMPYVFHHVSHVLEGFLSRLKHQESLSSLGKLLLPHVCIYCSMLTILLLNVNPTIIPRIVPLLVYNIMSYSNISSAPCSVLYQSL